MSGPAPLCWTCKHLVKELGNWHCKPFPDGVPDAVMDGTYKHRRILASQKGTLIYEPKEKEKKK